MLGKVDFGWHEMESLLNDGIVDPLEVEFLGAFQNLNLEAFVGRGIRKMTPELWLTVLRRGMTVRVRRVERHHPAIAELTLRIPAIVGVDVYLIARGESLVPPRAMSAPMLWIVAAGAVKFVGSASSSRNLLAGEHLRTSELEEIGFDRAGGHGLLLGCPLSGPPVMRAMPTDLFAFPTNLGAR